MKRAERIQAAIGRLADRFEFGHLQATTDPAGFLDTVCAELDRLRAGQPAATETAPVPQYSYGADGSVIMVNHEEVVRASLAAPQCAPCELADACRSAEREAQ